jgi:DNA-binding LacI/PurR family transcriptional regulator
MGSTQKKVAKLAGVSQSVVSRVFGGGVVSEAAKEKVLTIATSVGYQPDALARSLVTGQTGIVGIVMADVMNPFYPFVLEKFISALQKNGQQVLLFNAPRDKDVDEELSLVLQYRVKGIIITSASLSSRMARVCRENDTPVVLFNRYIPNTPTWAVSCDNVQGAREIADLLLDNKHTKIAYIGGNPNTSTNRDRKSGFIDRLAERGKKPLLIEDRAYSYEWGYEAASRFLRPSKINAVFCANDIIALGVIDAIRNEQKARIPEDISVIGFDDIPQAGWPSYSLTTMRQPVDEMIDVAIKLLDQDLDPRIREPRVHLIKGELITRSSVRSLPIRK